MPGEGVSAEGVPGEGGWGGLKTAFFVWILLQSNKRMYCFVLRTGAIGSEKQHVFADVINVSMASNYNGKI